ncbi:MAG: small acid-soluble spore protein Tlp [Christensenellales bacterium]
MSKPRSNNRPNPDNREDNVEKIQKNIDMTIHNMEAAEEMIEKTPDEKSKKALEDKNERRRQALDGFRSEIRDEARAQEHNDK